MFRNVLLLSLVFILFGCGQDQQTSPYELASASQYTESKTDNTGWWWYHGISAETLSQRLSQNRARLLDLKVESANPLRFSATVVRNSGAYLSGWWWYYGQTSAQVSEKLRENKARLINIDSYKVGSSKRFAVIMVPNTGANSKTWWWYHGLSGEQVNQRVDTNQTRIIDLKPVNEGSRKTFNVIMIRNRGSDSRSWWWYHGIEGGTISQRLRQNSAIITDIEREASGRYTVLMHKPNRSYKSWFYYGVSSTRLTQLYEQNTARVERISVWGSGTSKRFAVIMIDNRQALATRVARLLDPNETRYDAKTGFYLKQINGPVKAAEHAQRPMEVASALKSLHLLAAAKDVNDGELILSNAIRWSPTSSRRDDPTTPFDEAGNGCLNGFPPTSWLGLKSALERMMRNSDNRTTEAVRLLYDYVGLNDLAIDIGLRQTKVNHRIGCVGGVRNSFSPADAVRLYEVASGNTVLSNTSGKNAFWNSFPDSLFDYGQMIDEEIENAVSTVPLAERSRLRDRLNNTFKNRIVFKRKGGSYDICQPSATNCWPREIVRTDAGRLLLPVIQGARVGTRQLAYALFMERAIVSSMGQMTLAVDDWRKARQELLRDEVRSALATFL
ncbi:MAG: serine hydrolase [Pseudobacteriovorax sp.]|nr:serine hydrolase [Pseudobacteriovorax sp.]